MTEALMRTRQEYYDAMAGHRGDPDDTEAKANARLDAASLATRSPCAITKHSYAKINLALLERAVNAPNPACCWSPPQRGGGTTLLEVVAQAGLADTAWHAASRRSR